MIIEAGSDSRSSLDELATEQLKASARANMICRWESHRA